MVRAKIAHLVPWPMLALCACFSVSIGRKFDAPPHISEIQPCVTTEENLRAWFGEPFRRGNVDGLPVLQWAYYVRPAGSESKSDSLVVVLNRAGKVLHF